MNSLPIGLLILVCLAKCSALRCYSCGSGLFASCPARVLKPSLLVKCPNGSNYCETSTMARSKHQPEISRSCSSYGRSACLTSNFGKKCFSYCTTDGCNNADSAETGGSGLKCYECRHDTVTYTYDACIGPNINASLLVECPTGYNFCQTTTYIATEASGGAGIIRGCTDTPTSGCTNSPWFSGCVKTCTTSGCNAETFTLESDTRPPWKCYKCGGYSPYNNCDGTTSSELVDCPPSLPYCITTIVTSQNGVQTVSKKGCTRYTQDYCYTYKSRKQCSSYCYADGCNYQFTATGVSGLRCYGCMYQTAHSEYDECRGPSLNSSLMVQCTTGQNFCQTTILTSPEWGTHIYRSCASAPSDGCTVVSTLAYGCVKTCTTSGCNDDTELHADDDNMHPTNITAGSGLFCYNCTFNSTDRDHSCKGPKINSSLLMRCPSNENHCQIISRTSNSSEIYKIRGCTSSTSNTDCTDTSQGSTCIRTCNEDGCNDGANNGANEVFKSSVMFTIITSIASLLVKL